MVASGTRWLYGCEVETQREEVWEGSMDARFSKWVWVGVSQPAAQTYLDTKVEGKKEGETGKKGNCTQEKEGPSHTCTVCRQRKGKKNKMQAVSRRQTLCRPNFGLMKKSVQNDVWFGIDVDKRPDTLTSKWVVVRTLHNSRCISCRA